jgi:hypothetical protein
VTPYERLRAVASDGGAEVVVVSRGMTSVMLAVFVSTTFYGSRLDHLSSTCFRLVMFSLPCSFSCVIARWWSNWLGFGGSSLLLSTLSIRNKS